MPNHQTRPVPSKIPDPAAVQNPDHSRFMPHDAESRPAKPQPSTSSSQTQGVPKVQPALQANGVQAQVSQVAAPKYREPVQKEADGTRFNPIREVPTLTHQIPQEARRELNDAMAADSRSLNDTLKEPQRELSDRLTESPIRDLRKAIGINDRFHFISELFRGDETMYERSIKTINNFSIYQEAFYWMERELKLKLAWDMNKSSTQLFYHLVKRRFS